MQTNTILNIKSNSRKWKILDATNIKLIAVVLMFVDHIYQMWAHAGAPMWLDIFGRPVFPMFLFIAAESFHYTRSKKKYLTRLLFASWGMIIFTTLLERIVPNKNIVLMNNAFSTFFVSGLYMLFWDWLVEGIRNKSPKKIMKAILLGLIPILSALPLFAAGMLASNENVPLFVPQILVLIGMFIPNIMTVEGTYIFVILGLLYYIFRKHRFVQILILLLLSVILYIGNPVGSIQWLVCLATIPMALYNGERGRGMKNFFYIFYPAHIGLLYLISTFFG